MKTTINRATTQTGPYESIDDFWFQSPKDMPDSEDQENLNARIRSNKRNDSGHYEKIEFIEQKLSFTQRLQMQTTNPYITILPNTERDDYTSGMTRSNSDSHLHYTSENDYIQIPGVSNSLHLPVSGHSYHASLPNKPENQVDSLSLVDTSSSQKPPSPLTHAPTYEEMYSEELQTDKERVKDSDYEQYQFEKQVDTSPAVSLHGTDNAALQQKLQLSCSCGDISGTISNGLKQVRPTSSLDIPSCNDDSHLSVKSHSVSQVNMLAALNKDVYSFIANSLHPERKEKSQPSLSEIFERYSQNEHTMPAGVPLKRDNKRHLLFGKAASLDSTMLSSHSLCSSAELLSNNSGTVSLIQQRTLKDSSIKKMEE